MKESDEDDESWRNIEESAGKEVEVAWSCIEAKEYAMGRE